MLRLILAALVTSAALPSVPAMAEPLLIAHRGLSGEYPEHTLPAYRAAIEAGADFIEPDLVLTRDGVLVARHENEISETSDVATHPEFASRKTTKRIDGQDISGWFTEDFTLTELKSLRAKERLPQLRPANRAHDGQYEIATFEQILTLLAEVNKGRTRPVGVYPETKHPSYFAAIGLPHEAPLLALLGRFGYTQADSPVFIQSFEVGNLKRLRARTPVRLIQLVESGGHPADRPDLPYALMLTPRGLADVAAYANGIGPDKSLIIPRTRLGRLKQPTTLVKDAHDAGLLVHPWTFRRENYFLPSPFRKGLNPRGIGDLAGEIRAFAATGIDGLFTDNMPQAVAAVRRAQ